MFTLHHTHTPYSIVTTSVSRAIQIAKETSDNSVIIYDPALELFYEVINSLFVSYLVSLTGQPHPPSNLSDNTLLSLHAQHTCTGRSC